MARTAVVKRYQRGLRAALLLCACTHTRAADILSIGLQLPLYDTPECVEGWEYFHMARTAARSIEIQPWWRLATGNARIRFEVLANSDTFAAWEDAEMYAESPPPTCDWTQGGGDVNSTCRVIRAGIIGPSTAEAAGLVQLVTRQAGIPQLVYSVSAKELTPSAYKPLPSTWWDVSGPKWPFFRHGYMDEMAVGALLAFVGQMQWKMISVVHVRNAYGDASSLATQEVIERTQSGTDAIFMQNILSFAPNDTNSMDKVLDILAADVSRVVVLYAFSDDASTFMMRARLRDMVGKGWTWLGMEWVREYSWILAKQRAEAANMTATGRVPTAARSLSEGGGSGTSISHAKVAGSWLFGSSKIKPQVSAEDAVKIAMQGVVGVVPFRPPRDTVFGGLLDTFSRENTADLHKFMLNASGAFPIAARPTWQQCPGLYLEPVTYPGIPIDLVAPYVFDAVYALASATVDAITAATAASNGTLTGFGAIRARDIAKALYAGTTRESPLTGLRPTYLRTGDRYGHPMSLVNVRDGRVFTVGTWAPSIVPSANWSDGSVLAPGSALYDGAWTMSAKIVWSSGSNSPPPDRAIATSRAEAAALAAGLFGMVVSLLLGAVLHHAEIRVLPESGATVLVGAACGAVLRFMFGAHARDIAGFNAETFMLVLLPIIIFESGYSINKRTFFTQFFSINAFAIGGTIISAIVIGFIIYQAGQAGFIMLLTFEEAMSFASLLSATDPVATLAVFSSLKVQPVLNTLVYGEAVLNDAVAIVLYRTFTGFLVSDVTATATVWAILSFIGTLVFSTILGFLGGIFATLAFRYVNVTGQARTVRWERDFLSKLNKLRRLMPKIKVLTGDDASAGESQEHAASAAADDALEAIDLSSGIAETGILLLFSYLTFSFAEAIYLSGIVASLFCGISMNHYTRRVLTRDGKLTSSAVFRMLATLADTAVFFQIGLNVILNLGFGEYKAGFIATAVIACLIARACNIFPISALLNRKREDKISIEFQWQMWHAGLRGAIAFATALSFPSQNRDTIVNATSWICLFTIFGMGGTTVPMLRYLHIPFGIEESKDEQIAAAAESANSNSFKGLMAQFDEWLSTKLYGAGFLKEIDRLNAEARARAEERIARQLGVSTACPTKATAVSSLGAGATIAALAGAVGTAAMAVQPPAAPLAAAPSVSTTSVTSTNPLLFSAEDGPSPASTTGSRADRVFLTSVPPGYTPHAQPVLPSSTPSSGSVPVAPKAVTLTTDIGAGVFATTSSSSDQPLPSLAEMPHHLLSPIPESPPSDDAVPAAYGGSHSQVQQAGTWDMAASSIDSSRQRADSLHRDRADSFSRVHPHAPSRPPIGLDGADAAWPADLVSDTPSSVSHADAHEVGARQRTPSQHSRPGSAPLSGAAPPSPFDEWE